MYRWKALRYMARRVQSERPSPAFKPRRCLRRPVARWTAQPSRFAAAPLRTSASPYVAARL